MNAQSENAHSDPPAVEVRRLEVPVAELARRTNRLLGRRFLPLTGLTWLAALLNIVPFVLQGPLQIGLMRCFRATADERDSGVETLFSGFDRFTEGLIATLLLIAVSVAAFVFALPSFALILIGTGNDLDLVAALGWISYIAVILPVTAFQVLVMNFAYALMAEHDVRGVDAVRLALKGIAANLLPCLRLGLVTMAASVLGLLLCGVGIFLALPFVHGLVYLAHREIFGAAPRAVAAD